MRSQGTHIFQYFSSAATTMFTMHIYLQSNLQWTIQNYNSPETPTRQSRAFIWCSTSALLTQQRRMSLSPKDISSKFRMALLQKRVNYKEFAEPVDPSWNTTKHIWISRHASSRHKLRDSLHTFLHRVTSEAALCTTVWKYSRHSPTRHKQWKRITPLSPTWQRKTRHFLGKWHYKPTVSSSRRRTMSHCRQ